MGSISQASRKAFKEDIERLDDKVLTSCLMERNIKSWSNARSWLEFHMPFLLEKSLEAKWFYKRLLAVAVAHGLSPMKPHDFVHSGIPVASQVKLVLIYRTRERLRDAVADEHTPRGDVYAAYLLGLITKENLDRAPVKLSTEARYNVRRKRRR